MPFSLETADKKAGDALHLHVALDRVLVVALHTLEHRAQPRLLLLDHLLRGLLAATHGVVRPAKPKAPEETAAHAVAFVKR